MDLVTQFWNQQTLIWIAITAFLIGLLINVLHAGRLGWGWTVLTSTRTFASFLLSILVTMFVEVTADNEGMGNWDDD